MSSPYWVMIKLEPHYQRFLRSQFQCNSEIFEFPARHYFNTMLEHFVVTRREGHVENEAGEWSFKIGLPNFAHKNPAFFRYLSETRENIFKTEIKSYYDWIIQKRIRELMANKLDKDGEGSHRMDRQECTLYLIEEYGFNKDDQDSFDRLYRLFSRFQQNESMRNYRQKKRDDKVTG